MLTSFFFFFNDTATTEIYTLSLHDALPIFSFCASRALFAPKRCHHSCAKQQELSGGGRPETSGASWRTTPQANRSEEHTSELQSQSNLVCRLLLEKKKNNANSSLAGASRLD